MTIFVGVAVPYVDELGALAGLLLLVGWLCHGIRLILDARKMAGDGSGCIPMTVGHRNGSPGWPGSAVLHFCKSTVQTRIPQDLCPPAQGHGLRGAVGPASIPGPNGVLAGGSASPYGWRSSALSEPAFARLPPSTNCAARAWNLARGNVRPGEDVLVVVSSDQEPALVDALVAAADAAGAGTATAAVIACPADMADYRHPAPVVAAAERAGLTIVATSIRFPRAYDDLSRALFAAGRRQVLINNAPLEDFVRGAALADPEDLLARTRRLAGAVSAAQTVRVRSPNGTDLTVRVCRPCLPLTGFAEEDTGFGSFPSGEAMLSPEEGSAEGVFVADAFGQVVYLAGAGPQLGLLEDPARLEFAAGRLTDLSGGAAARRLEAVLDAADGNARLLAELGLGTNPHARARRPCGKQVPPRHRAYRARRQPPDRLARGPHLRRRDKEQPPYRPRLRQCQHRDRRRRRPALSARPPPVPAAGIPRKSSGIFIFCSRMGLTFGNMV